MHTNAPLTIPTPAQLIVFLIAWALLYGGIGVAVGRIKGAAWLGFICGLLLGPVGLVWTLFRQPASDPNDGMSTPRRRLKRNGRVLKCLGLAVSVLVILAWMGSAVLDLYYIRPYNPPRSAPAGPSWSNMGITCQYVIGIEARNSVLELDNMLWFNGPKGLLTRQKTMGLHIERQEFDFRHLLPGKIVPWINKGPLWRIELPFWVLFLCVAIPTARLSWRDRPFPAQTCRQCGYDLTGNTSGVCPECGTNCRF